MEYVARKNKRSEIQRQQEHWEEVHNQTLKVQRKQKEKNVSADRERIQRFLSNPTGYIETWQEFLDMSISNLHRAINNQVDWYNSPAFADDKINYEQKRETIHLILAGLEAYPIGESNLTIKQIIASVNNKKAEELGPDETLSKSPVAVFKQMNQAYTTIPGYGPQDVELSQGAIERYNLIKPALLPKELVIFQRIIQLVVDRILPTVEDVNEFIAYKNADAGDGKPTFQAIADFKGYGKFTEAGKKPTYYQTALKKRIRNIHRFFPEVLDRQILNYAHKVAEAEPAPGEERVSERPRLIVVFHATHDETGALALDPNLKDLVLKPDISGDAKAADSFMVLITEGKDKVIDYKGTFDALAKDYGRWGRIDQLIVHAHGLDTGVTMGDAISKSSVGNEKPGRLSFKNNKNDTEIIFDEILRNMELNSNVPDAEKAAGSRIVFAACLTNSNNLDDAFVGSQYGNDPQMNIRIWLRENKNFVESVKDYITPTGKKFEDNKQNIEMVIGSNAVTTTAVKLIDENNEIGLFGGNDPAITNSKLDYIRYGKEHESVLTALTTEWGTKVVLTDYQNSDLFKTVSERANADATDIDDALIRGLFVVLTNPSGNFASYSVLQKIRGFGHDFEDIKYDEAADESLEVGGAVFKALTPYSRLGPEMMDQFLASLLATSYRNSDQVIFSVLMGLVYNKPKERIPDLMTYLSSLSGDDIASAIIPHAVNKGIDPDYLRLTGIFDEAVLNSTADKAQLILAVAGLKSSYKSVVKKCKTFLQPLVKSPALDELKAVLPDMYLRNFVREKFGLGGAEVSEYATTKNIPLQSEKQKGTDTYDVRPTYLVISAENAGVYLSPEDQTPTYTLTGGNKIYTAGSYGASWYVVDWPGYGTAFVRKADVDIENVQRKSLEISNPMDADEQEADSVAKKVVGGENAEISGSGSSVNRKGGDSVQATDEFKTSLEQSKGSGEALPVSVRGEMESKMNADFGGVKIHTGGEAHSMSRSINAQAFTHGQDIYFSNGAYDSGSGPGKELLAHELVHTVQQSNRVQTKIHRAIKMEFQTGNFIWNVKGDGASAEPLERKFGKHGANTEGDGKEAYLTTGKHGKSIKEGEPAVKIGDFVEVKKGPLGMIEGKQGKYNMKLPAQFIRTYKVKTEHYAQVTYGNILPDENMDMLADVDRSATLSADQYNAGTYEIRYQRPTGEGMAMHRDEKNVIRAGSIPLMVPKDETSKIMVDATGFDKGLLPQFVMNYEFTKPVVESEIIGKTVTAGDLSFLYQNTATSDYNPGAYQYMFYDENFHLMDLHIDLAGKYQKGIKQMVMGKGYQNPDFVASKKPQFKEIYKVTPDDAGEYELDGKKVAVTLVQRTDQSKIFGEENKYFPGETDKRYYDASAFTGDVLNKDAKQLKFHVGQGGKFEAGKTEVVNMQAQWVELIKLPGAENGIDKLIGTVVQPQVMETFNNNDKPELAGKVNQNTWEKKYYAPAAFDADNKFIAGSTKLDVHVDTEGKLRYGHVQYMEKSMYAREAKGPNEQTAIELQSETGGFLEFETPKWFTKWSDLRLRVEDAYNMTQQLNGLLASDELKAGNPVYDTIAKRVAALIKSKKRDDWRTMGRIVPWPFDTSHMDSKLGGGKLYVEIRNERWTAHIQTSEGIELTQVASLLQEHGSKGPINLKEGEKTGPDLTTPVLGNDTQKGIAKEILDAANTGNIKADNLLGLLQLIMTYILYGQYYGASTVKFAFLVMSRTNFHSIFRDLLSTDEQNLYKKIVNDPSNPILTKLTPIADANKKEYIRLYNIENNEKAQHETIKLTRSTPFFPHGYSGHAVDATYGESKTKYTPTIYEWLVSIYSGWGVKGKGHDKLSPLKSGSASMGRFDVETAYGKDDRNLVKLEMRSSEGHGGDDWPADQWVNYAETLFKYAAQNRNRADVPDDPSTPDINESTQTGLIYDPENY